MTQTRIRSDAELKASVINEVDWTPSVNGTHIGVAVNDGVVTLSGEVDSYPERRLAEKAAFRIHGVTAVADEMTVRSPWVVTDTDLAQNATQALEASVEVPAHSVKVTVHDRVITLSGTVLWQFQREAAARAVRHLKGVANINNTIALEQTAVSTSDIHTAITAALVRNAQLEGHEITVVAGPGGQVTLAGTVGAAAESRSAQHAAWSAPGVTAVVNQLRIVN
jgi:osmotically-inducible protein OsmY